MTPDASELRALIAPVALRLLGEANRALSTKTELRYGSHGSLSIDLGKGTYYDHEDGTGGGVLDLIQRETGRTDDERIQWLIGERLLVDRKPNGNGHDRKSNGHDLGRIVKTYPYVDEHGQVLFEVVRYEPKTFRQRRPDPNKPGGWVWKLDGVRQVPYRLPELVSEIELGKRVFIVEGEKDVDRLRSLGAPATTNAQGAGNWDDALNPIFAGADVVIIADNDPQTVHPKTGELMFHPDGRPKLPGQDHAQEVAAALSAVAKVRVLDLSKVWPECPAKGDVSDWLANGGTADALYALVDGLPLWAPAAKRPEPANVVEAEGPREFAPLEGEGAEPATKRLIWYGDTPPTPPPYLVDETLPEIGVASIAGQWGAAKTFVGADLVSALIVGGGEFANKAVNRTGGAVWFAAEGENEIETRVKAAIGARGGDPNAKQPFARQAEGVPCLTDKDALERLRVMVKEAAAHMRKAFDRDLVAIFFDTLSAAAGFEDENSAPETQRVMNIMRALANEFKMLVVFIDHYGKVADTGIRGSSAKSGAADAILACLGDRNQETGAWSNRRMALAKLRSGSNGRIVNFSLAQTDDGETCTVAWSAAEAVEAAPKGKPLPKSLRTLKRAFDEALGAFGKDTVPRVGMPAVKAVDREHVRAEFFRLYVADNHAAKKQAFLAGVKDAVERNILCALNVGPDLSQTILWTAQEIST